MHFLYKPIRLYVSETVIYNALLLCYKFNKYMYISAIDYLKKILLTY